MSAQACGACGGHRFAPSWVEALTPINRQVSAQITRSSPEYGESVRRITLAKWWPGGRASFHVPSPEQWGKLRDAVEHHLGPKLGWKILATRSRSTTWAATPSKAGL